MGTQGCQGGADPGAGSVCSQTRAGSRIGVDCMGSRSGFWSGVCVLPDRSGLWRGLRGLTDRSGLWSRLCRLCRCLPKKRRAPTHGRRQHSWWSEPSPPRGTARLATSTPRRRPPLSSGPTSVWRQPSLSAALRGRQRAALSF